VTVSYFSKGAFEPHDLTIIQNAFNTIVDQPWFDKSAGAQGNFAKYLIDTFPDGQMDLKSYLAEAETSARMFFSVHEIP
jgi:hypothetical protein